MDELYVVFLQAPVPDDLDSAAAWLADSFGLPLERAFRLFDRAPGAVTRPVGRTEAIEVASVLRAAGMYVEIREGTAKGPAVQWDEGANAAPATNADRLDVSTAASRGRVTSPTPPPPLPRPPRGRFSPDAGVVVERGAGSFSESTTPSDEEPLWADPEPDTGPRTSVSPEREPPSDHDDHDDRDDHDGPYQPDEPAMDLRHEPGEVVLITDPEPLAPDLATTEPDPLGSEGILDPEEFEEADRLTELLEAASDVPELETDPIARVTGEEALDFRQAVLEDAAKVAAEVAERSPAASTETCGADRDPSDGPAPTLDLAPDPAPTRDPAPDPAPAPTRDHVPDPPPLAPVEGVDYDILTDDEGGKILAWYGGEVDYEALPDELRAVLEGRDPVDASGPKRGRRGARGGRPGRHGPARGHKNEANGRKRRKK